MTDRYENIRRALADMDAAAEARHALAWQDAHARFAVHVTPGTIRALLAERDALREALTEVLRVNETDAGSDVKVWANAMLNAHAALEQEAGRG